MGDAECAHPIQAGGLCALCGKEIDECVRTNSTTFGPTFATLHSSANVKVSRDEAERIDRESTEALLNARKLALIVDLDQTIIHTTIDPVIGELIRSGSHEKWDSLSDIVAFQLGVDGVTVTSEPAGIDKKDPSTFATGGEDGGCWYYVKKRPGLDTFLNTLKSRFELHVYTMGARSYADCICRIVDPTGTLFGSRILTRDENESLAHKSLARLFPVNTSMVSIIDDRADVWDWSPNLVKVQPYEFFLGIGNINGAHLAPDAPLVPVPEGSAAAAVEASGTAEKKIGEHKPAENVSQPQPDKPAEAEEPPALLAEDHELELIQDVLTLMHTRWYAANDRNDAPSVEFVLRNIKHGVLDGCGLAFSGLIPLSEEPESSAIWKHAEEFGAECHNEITRHLTHLVAANPGTAKTAEAHRLGVKVVWPSWLNDSICRWVRQPEGPYLLPHDPAPAAQELQADENLGDPHALDGLATMDWGEAEDEVDAFLGDDDEDSELHSSTGEQSREVSPSPRDEVSASPSKRRKLGPTRTQSKLCYGEVYDEEAPASDDNFLDNIADEMERQLEDE